MNRRFTLVAGACLLAGAGLLASVAVSQEGSGQPGMHGQQGGMMGNMMQGCPMMSRGTSSASAGLFPQLPPGNEKLQAQMQAEIMQKAGEIAAKYAAQTK